MTPKLTQRLTRHAFLDTWFPVRHSLRVYQGCDFGCGFCPAPASPPGQGADWSEVMGGLPEGSLLGFGSGLEEVYQKREKLEHRTREALKAALDRKLRPYILTRSALLERDLGLLARFPENAKPIVVMSFAFPDDAGSRHHEPGSPLPRERLAILKRCSEAGLLTGVLYMPLVPGVNDGAVEMEMILQGAREAGCTFAMSGFYQWEKEGSENNFRSLPEAAKAIQSFRLSPNTAEDYRLVKTREWVKGLARNGLLPFPSLTGIKENLSPRDQTVVFLEQLFYLNKYLGKERSAFRQAAVGINWMNEDIFGEWIRAGNLKRVAGIGPWLEKAVEDLILKRETAIYDATCEVFLNPAAKTTGEESRKE